MGLGMCSNKKNILLIATPFAETAIPSIQLEILAGYLHDRNIDIKTRHLYLKAAEFYGLNNYNYLIGSPNDPYSAQMFYSKYLFPEHWRINEGKIKDFFIKKQSKYENSEINLSFEDYVKQTDKFNDWFIENVKWKSYDIIGFSINYGQLLPSLVFAKKIKEICPEKKVIFGGSGVINSLGVRILETFDYIDFIVSGDGEEALYLLASDYQNYQTIPNLIYRNGEEIIWNKSDLLVDLDNLPIPSYDSFYSELNSTSDEIKQYFLYFGRFSIEISRGCWWNKCTFCNQKVLHQVYREKNVDKIVEEIKFLSDKYKMLNFQITGDTILKNDYKNLLNRIKILGRNFNFFVEVRAGQLKREDYKELKEAGFNNIQVGIEAFSQNYLKKMNKGVRVIDNIASLKFCKENGINNRYNLIVNYPNEEKIDFEETKSNIQLFKQYLDPPNISYFTVSFGSSICNNPENFNIEMVECGDIDKMMFPKEILDKGISFFYSFKRKDDIEKNNWEKLIKNWNKERHEVTDKLIFYFLDGESFIKIYDKRDKENIRIYVLDETEREIFLTCLDVISFEDLQTRFSNIPEYHLAAILHTFESKGIVFQEDNRYLSLPLCYKNTSYKLFKEEKVATCL